MFFKPQEPKRSATMKMLCHRKHLLLLTILFAAAAAIGAFGLAYATNGSVAYSYDALGRVTTASYDTGVCVIYAYDPNGNRTAETINVTTGGAIGVWGCFNWNQAGSGGALWGATP
jgi:YD repeat-containing protein